MMNSGAFQPPSKSVRWMPSDAQLMNTEQNYSWGNNINALYYTFLHDAYLVEFFFI